MAFVPPEHSREIRSALAEIVAEYGPEALSRPKSMTGLLADLLPDAPQLARLIVAAAQDGIADELRGHVAQGLDTATAATLVTSSFASATLITPEACAWVVGEFAIALGLMSDAIEPAATISPPPEPRLAATQTQPEPGVRDAGVPTVTAAHPPDQAYQAGGAVPPPSVTASDAQSRDLGSAQPPPRRPQAMPSRRTNLPLILPVAMLGVGVAFGIAGLFPPYGGTAASIASLPDSLAEHAIDLAAWTASAALILLGGARMRVGALIGLGTSAIVFGRFFTDFGWAIVDRALRPGLVLGFVGWLACAIGSILACRTRLASGRPGPVSGREGRNRVAAALIPLLAGLGAAIAWVPPWDSIGTSTCCNAFNDPKLALTGDLAFMIAIVAVASAAGLWRPVRLGAALLGGAIAPMAAQVIRALIGKSSGGYSLTPVFWVYAAFVAALMLYCVRMIVTSDAIGGAAHTSDAG